jgi:hypothetical protein
METNKLYRLIAFTLFSLISLPAFAQGIPYGTGQWDRQRFGNHRVVIQVTKDTDIVWVHVP